MVGSFENRAKNKEETKNIPSKPPAKENYFSHINVQLCSYSYMQTYENIGLYIHLCAHASENVGV